MAEGSHCGIDVAVVVADVVVAASAGVASAGEANAVLVVAATLGQNIGHLVHKILCRSTFNLGQL